MLKNEQMAIKKYLMLYTVNGNKSANGSSDYEIAPDLSVIMQVL